MKELNNFILEKFKINKNIKPTQAQENNQLFPLIQDENHGERGGYSSFFTGDIRNNYNYCFVEYNEESEFIALQAFNDFEEYSEIPGWDERDVKVLSRLNPGESSEIQAGSLCVRIW